MRLISRTQITPLHKNVPFLCQAIFQTAPLQGLSNKHLSAKMCRFYVKQFFGYGILQIPYTTNTLPVGRNTKCFISTQFFRQPPFGGYPINSSPQKRTVFVSSNFSDSPRRGLSNKQPTDETLDVSSVRNFLGATYKSHSNNTSPQKRAVFYAQFLVASYNKHLL